MKKNILIIRDNCDQRHLPRFQHRKKIKIGLIGIILALMMIIGMRKINEIKYIYLNFIILINIFILKYIKSELIYQDYFINVI